MGESRERAGVRGFPFGALKLVPPPSVQQDFVAGAPKGKPRMPARCWTRQICSMKVSAPARRRADAQGTADVLCRSRPTPHYVKQGFVKPLKIKCLKFVPCEFPTRRPAGTLRWNEQRRVSGKSSSAALPFRRVRACLFNIPSMRTLGKSALRRSRPAEGAVVDRLELGLRGRERVWSPPSFPYVLNGYMGIKARMTSTGAGKA